MTTYDFLSAKQAIRTYINLTQFSFGQRLTELAHEYGLNKRFWAMFEPISTWPNFAFGQLLIWIDTNIDHVWIPKVNIM